MAFQPPPGAAAGEAIGAGGAYYSPQLQAQHNSLTGTGAGGSQNFG